MARRWKRRVAHVPHGTPYAVENSKWFLRLLKVLGFVWVDFDGNVTKDGVPVCGHWGLIAKNGFLLPKWFKQKYGKNPKISDVYWADLAKLQTRPIIFRGRRRYKFMTLWTAIELATQLKRKIMYEQKGSRTFRLVDFWAEVAWHMNRVGMPNNHFVVGTLPDMAGAGAVLAAAHAAGRETMVIRAQNGVPRSWEQNMTWYRGRIKWIYNK